EQIQLTQRRDRPYVMALTAAQAAFKGTNYAQATLFVNEALDLKNGDAKATELQNQIRLAREAQQQQAQVEQKYQTVIREAQAALEGNAYAKAIKRATLALGIKPGDFAATQLRDYGQRRLAQAKPEERRELYKAARTEGAEALARRDFDKAIELAD